MNWQFLVIEAALFLLDAAYIGWQFWQGSRESRVESLPEGESDA